MRDDHGEPIVVAAIIIGVLVVLFVSCGLIAYDSGFEEGYTTALQDMKKNKPPKYVLVEQEDGTMVWEKNKEL